MASTSAYASLKALVTGAVTPLGVYDYDEIEPVLQQGSTKFVVLEELTSDEAVIGIGDPTNICSRENSLVTVYCFTPAPESSSAARTLAEQVQQAIRFHRAAHFRIRRVSPPEMGNLNDGLWSFAMIDVNVELDSFAAAS